MIPADEDDPPRRRMRDAGFDELLEHIDSEEQRVRNAASVALARRAEEDPDGTLEHVSTLASRLDRSDAVVRSQVSAATATVAGRNPDAIAGIVPALVEHLDDDSLLVRENVLEALFEVAKTEPEAVEPATGELVAQLELDPAFVRAWAVHVLVHVAMNSPTAVEGYVPDLVSYLREVPEEPEFQESHEHAPPSNPARERQRDPFRQVSEDERARWRSLREGIALILATLAPHRPEQYRSRVPELAPLVTDDSRIVRKSVVEVLGCVAEDDAPEIRSTVPELADRLREDDAEIVRSRAAWALSLVGAEDEAVAEEVSTELSPIRDLLDSDDVEVRTAGANLLVTVAETDPERAASLRPVVSELLEDESDVVRRQSAWVLALVGGESAERRLETLRDSDPDPEVRGLAAELLRSTGEDGERPP